MKQRLYRRTFTKLSLLSGGALVVPAIGAAPVSASNGFVLSADVRMLIETFAEAMLPTEGTSLKPQSEVPIADNVAHALALLDDPVLEQVRLGFKLFDYGAFLLGFHFKRFVNLSIEQRVDYIHRWEDGIATQRGIVDLLKKLTYLGYWEDVEAARAIGYLGPVSVAGGVPNLGNAPMPPSDPKP